VQAVGIGGIAVGQVVDLAVGTGAAIGVKAGALQGLDVAPQVIAQVFVVVVGARDHTRTMLAKLAVWGVTREAAIKRMLEAIQLYQIEGVATTLPFGRFVCQHEAFISGKFDTGFVKNHYTPEGMQAQQKEEAEVAARLALEVLYHHKRQLAVPDPGGVEWYTKR
jgi:hypothetical protein